MYPEPRTLSAPPGYYFEPTEAFFYVFKLFTNEFF
jgi:hypothetical protein